MIKTDTSTNPIPIRRNVGKPCHEKCEKDGHCFWCGLEGMCCKQGRILNGCDGIIGGADEHECTAEEPGMMYLKNRLSAWSNQLN